MQGGGTPMRVDSRQPDGERDLDVALRTPEATLRDVLRAVVGEDRVPESVAIDDRVLPSDAPVLDAGLHEGAVLTPGEDAAARPPRAALELVVLAGLDAGRAYPPAARRT